MRMLQSNLKENFVTSFRDIEIHLIVVIVSS